MRSAVHSTLTVVTLVSLLLAGPAHVWASPLGRLTAHYLRYAYMMVKVIVMGGIPGLPMVAIPVCPMYRAGQPHAPNCRCCWGNRAAAPPSVLGTWIVRRWRHGRLQWRTTSVASASEASGCVLCVRAALMYVRACWKWRV